MAIDDVTLTGGPAPSGQAAVRPTAAERPASVLGPAVAPTPNPTPTPTATPATTGRRRTRVAAVGVAVADAAGVAAGLALTGTPSWPIALYLVGILLTLLVLGEYRLRLTLRALADAPRLVGRVLLPSAILVLSPFALDQPNRALTRVLGAVVGLLVARAVAYAVLRILRQRQVLAEPTVIVGAGTIGTELAGLLDQHRQYGLSVVGFVDDVPAFGGPPLLGGIGELEDVLAELDVARLIVAFTPARDETLVRVIRAATRHDVVVHIVPRFFEVGLAPSGADVDQVWGIPLYRVKRAALRASVFRVKRIGDVVLSATALALLSPLLAVLALLVKRSSPGPILFRQVRIGQHGRPIEVLKFRTMRLNDDSEVTWSVSDDERVTGVGRWMRRLSLDELPQFVNVLRGDMSLVGPRPERPYFVNRFSTVIPGYGDRHRLPVGLTGLAQVHGLRGDTSIRERARFDNAYVEHWSPWLDLTIMIRTLTSVVRQARKGD
ncbi:MAG: exopolysaccharide biosynthesis polyprenyl glycosylphosphotransferase [Acidimicrobiales bacterium]|nr:exopolysaccharide biosynthesis polyprenyl glycosylphosphotransferase [Acidimicrobiales bacterium]